MLNKQEIEKLSGKEAQDFVLENANADVTQLVLNWKNQLPIGAVALAGQIAARKKAEHKLPTFYQQYGLVYPAALSMEQSSSEETANYKAALLPQKTTITDFTGGLGVDTYCFSKVASSVNYIEQQQELCLLAEHNFKLLQCTNINVHNKTLEEYFQEWQLVPTDIAYLDPARRNSAQKKVFLLEDCTPDIQQWAAPLLQHCKEVWVKLSPLFDIHLLNESLGKYLQQIHIISVKNDCKELLVQFVANPKPLHVHAVNLATNQPAFEADFNEKAQVHLSPPLRYIFEPNASIMKSGLYNNLAENMGLKKLQIHTHLFTSDNLMENFPGRIFECLQVFAVDKKLISKQIVSKKANISTRNFPLKPEELYKKLGLQSGGDDYLIGVTLGDNKKAILHCKKIN